MAQPVDSFSLSTCACLHCANNELDIHICMLWNWCWQPKTPAAASSQNDDVKAQVSLGNQTNTTHNGVYDTSDNHIRNGPSAVFHVCISQRWLVYHIPSYMSIEFLHRNICICVWYSFKYKEGIEKENDSYSLYKRAILIVYTYMVLLSLYFCFRCMLVLQEDEGNAMKCKMRMSLFMIYGLVPMRRPKRVRILFLCIKRLLSLSLSPVIHVNLHMSLASY